MIGNADKLKAIICQGISFYDSFQVISRSLNQMANAFLNRSKNDISIGDIRKGDLKSVEFNTPNIDGKT